MTPRDLPPVAETDAAGLRVVVEQRVSPSATLLCRIDTGARDEAPWPAGITHLLEHALLASGELPERIAALGGQANGYTTREELQVFCRVPLAQVERALDLLAECVLAPLDPHETLIERAVVLEELQAVELEPGDVIHDLIYESALGGHPLAVPTAGTPDSVRAIEPAAVQRFRDERVHRGTVSLAVVSALDADAVRAAVERSRFADVPTGTWTQLAARVTPTRKLTVRRDLQSQYVHTALALVGFAEGDARAAAADVVAMLLDGALFVELRERLTVVYGLDCWHRTFRDTGLLRAVFAVAPHHAETALRAAVSTVEAALERAWPVEEIEHARGRCEAQLALDWDAPVDHAMQLARRGDPALRLAELAAVTPADVAAVCATLAARGVRCAVAGALGVAEAA
jgi:predicted Zn-dependent peptidase